MWKYWAEKDCVGETNSETFKVLLRLIDKGQLEGEQSGEFGSSFSRSFPNRANKVWNKLSGAHLKPRHDDVAGMIDDKCVGQGFVPRPVLEGEQGFDPEKWVEQLCKKNKELGNDDDSSEDGQGRGAATEPSPSSNESESSSSEEEDEAGAESEEETEDDWEKARGLRPSAARQRKQRDRLRVYDSDDDGLFDTDAEQPKGSNIVTPHRRILEDSEDET